MESKKNQKDLVEIFSDLGKGLKKVFKPMRRTGTVDATHGFTFGVVYANDLAKPEIEKENPQFAVGSIIVREKNSAVDSLVPETVIAMVKREKGFSPKTGDWEFFTFNGADLKIKRRETTSDCAKCHIRAEKTDWVFRDYLK